MPNFSPKHKCRFIDASPLADFSVKLRRLRDHCGFNQSDLADFMHITQPAYHKMECNGEPPRTKRLQQIAQFYDFPLSELLDLPAEKLIQKVKKKKNPPPPASERVREAREVRTEQNASHN